MVAPIVDADWVRAHRDAVVLADVRWYLDGRSGRAAYDAGHLPGAVFVDLDEWLAAHAARPRRAATRCPSPSCSPTGMARSASATTTPSSPTTTRAASIAARLVWMLRVTGHDAALLDGGLAAWDGPLETAPPQPAAAARSRARPWPADRLAAIDDAADPTNVVLDARQRERYRGDADPIDPRAGPHPGRAEPARRASTSTRPGGCCPSTSCAGGSPRSGVGPNAAAVVSYLRLGRDGLPQPARHGARRGSGTAGCIPARGRNGPTTRSARSRQAKTLSRSE